MEGSDRTVAHLAPGEGESVWLLGDLYTFKAESEDTGGAFALWETTTPPQGGPPPHLHHPVVLAAQGAEKVALGRRQPPSAPSAYEPFNDEVQHGGHGGLHGGHGEGVQVRPWLRSG